MSRYKEENVAVKSRGKYKKRGNPWQHQEKMLIIDEDGNPVKDKGGEFKYKNVPKDWRIYYFEPDKNDSTKKGKQRYKFGFKTKKDALEALNEIQGQILNNQYAYGNKMTLGEFLTLWLKKYVPNSGLSVCTIRGYEVNVRRHIIPFVGNFKLTQITCRDLEDLYLKLWNNGAGININTIKYVRATLVSALNEALKDRLVNRNEAKLSKISHKISQSDFEYVTYSVAEIVKLLEFAKGTYLELAIALGGILGLRRSEALGLKYSKINMETGMIKIDMQLVFDNKQLFYKEVKSGSKRDVFATNYIKTVIEENKKNQLRNMQLFGEDYYQSDYVITRDNGQPIIPERFSKEFSSLLKKSGLRHIRFHDLRHSCNSIMKALSIGKEERKALTGHRTDKMDELYLHISKEEMKKVSKILGDEYDKYM